MGSYDYGKAEMVFWVKQNFPKGSTCLDVGACDGKWFELLGDYLQMDGIEIFKPYIDKYHLKQKYKRCLNMDIADFEYEYFDLIIFGDVIEHMSVEKAQKVISYAMVRCKDVLIGVPWRYIQGEVNGNKYEIHLQDDLTEELFHERYPGFEKLYEYDKRYAYFHLKK